MSEAETIDSQIVLIVADGQDESLLECGEKLRSCGLMVHSVPDVYSAMARLARDFAARRVIVDIRRLDNHEMNFLNLAPRYYEKLQVMVPLLEGTTERAASHPGNYSALPLGAISDSLLGIRGPDVTELQDAAEVVEWSAELPTECPEAEIAEVAEEFVELPESNPEVNDVFSDSLSTGGGTESTIDGPSLHEAVRQRMADTAFGADPIRRKPPAGSPVDSHHAPQGDASTLSAEEINALLKEEEDNAS